MTATVTAVRSARHRRYATVLTCVVLVGVVVAALTLSIGDLAVPLPDVVHTLLGRGDALDDFVVLHLRLPRLALAVVSGAALALSGALFQALLHNALASPDVVGITGGASVASVFAILILGLSGPLVSLFAVAGALVVALLILALAWDRGVAGHRFVLIGVGIAFLVTGALGYLLTRADVVDAQAALVWLVGSVGSADWTDIAVSAGAFAVLAALAVRFGAQLRLLQLDDDTARALGVRTDRVRLGLLALAVALAAVGTAATGPLAFVAFVSAPIARRLVRDGGPALLPSAVLGAVVVVIADFIGQHLVPGGGHLPAGVVTGALGAPYLLWLLVRGART